MLVIVFEFEAEAARFPYLQRISGSGIMDYFDMPLTALRKGRPQAWDEKIFRK